MLRSLSRRNFMRGAGMLAAAPLLPHLGRDAWAGVAPTSFPVGNAGRGDTRVVLLGTTGGPSYWPDSTRVSASSALVVYDPIAKADRIYVIDLGDGAMIRLAEAFNSGTFVNTPKGKVQHGYSLFLADLKAVFFTHLHMDHTTDYPSLLLYGQGAGLIAYDDDEADLRLPVYGPGTRGQLEDVYPPGRTDVAATMNPADPTPGTTAMTQYLWNAYAQTINDFARDDNWGDFSHIVSLHDIGLPPLPRADYPIDPTTGKSLNTAPWPVMRPIPVYADSWVSVTATLVNHGPVYPSLAFRFDTADGSVVFSGDTGYPCSNLTLLARDADVLVHEVIDPLFADLLFNWPLSEEDKPMYNHLTSAHTSIVDAGRAASAAGVGTLVLNHIVPGNTPRQRLLDAGRHFGGRLIIGQDLAVIGVGRQRPH
jgi:ribonuclease BN (tRNA processing enzyme)